MMTTNALMSRYAFCATRSGCENLNIRSKDLTKDKKS